jgi:hypothetical protein
VAGSKSGWRVHSLREGIGNHRALPAGTRERTSDSSDRIGVSAQEQEDEPSERDGGTWSTVQSEVLL